MHEHAQTPSRFTRILSQARQGWDEFFFRPETPHALAMLRIVMPLVLLYAAIPRWFAARELFSLDGAPTPFWVHFGGQPFLPILPAPLAVALFTLLVVCLCCVSIGWMTRASLAVCVVLYPYFGLVDMVSTLTKYTVVSTHLMLLLLFSDCGKVWSVDAWLSGGSHGMQPPVSSWRWPRRLIQILIGVVYFGAATTKMHIPRFLSGDHMTFWMLSDLNHPHPAGHWMSLQPGFMIATSYITVIWEVLFLFIAWRGVSRWVMLGMGLVFHVMTAFTLGLYVFPTLYLACYLAFLEDHEARWLGQQFARLGRKATSRLPVFYRRPQTGIWISAAAFGVVLAASTVIGVELEAKLDRYGLQRAEGRYPLQPLPPERVEELLRNDLNLAPEDTLFSLAVGTTAFGNVLVNRCDMFRSGESILAQAMLVTPHADVWVEANLHDASDVVVDRRGVVCPREEVRALFRYDVRPELAAGTYHLVLSLDGHEVARKTVTISN